MSTHVRRRWPRRLLFATVVIGLYFLGDALALVLRGIVPGQQMVADPTTARAVSTNSALNLAVKAGVALMFFGLALSVPRRLPAVLARIAPLAAFFAYAVWSLSWSETPSNSVTDCLYLGTAIAAGVALSMRFDATEATRAFACSGAAIALTSLLMVFVFPRYGVHGADEGVMADLAGAWRGVFNGKNALGQTMAPFVVIFATSGHRLFGSRPAQIALTAVALLLVLFSRSVSALSLTVIGFAVYAVLFRMDGIKRLVVLLLTPILAIAASLMVDTVLAALGRGSDMSGRAYIWAAARRMIVERPWFGYGYGSATLGGLTRYVSSRFQALHVHNGYLDLALYCGLIGSALFYASVLIALRRALRLNATGDAGQRLMAQVFGTFLMVLLVAAWSEVAFRPNVTTGAFGFVCIVMLSVPRPLRRRVAGGA